VTNVLLHFSLFLTDSLRIFVSWRGMKGELNRFLWGHYALLLTIQLFIDYE